MCSRVLSCSDLVSFGFSGDELKERTNSLLSIRSSQAIVKPFGQNRDKSLCNQQGRDPCSTFFLLLARIVPVRQFPVNLVRHQSFSNSLFLPPLLLHTFLIRTGAETETSWTKLLETLLRLYRNPHPEPRQPVHFSLRKTRKDFNGGLQECIV